MGLVALSFLLVSSPSWAKATARLRAEATVSGPVVLLRDVAKIDGAGKEAATLGAVELGPSSLPGYSRSFGADAVRIQLRRHKLDPALLAKGPALICRVTRAFQTLPGDRLTEAARAYLQGQADTGSGKVAAEPVTRPRDLTLPVGKVELAVEPVGAYTSGASRQVAVQVKVDGKPIQRVPLSLRLRQAVRVAVSKAAVPRSESLSAGQIDYVERDRMSLPPDVILEGEPLDGLQAVQSIPAGIPLTRRMAAAPAAVRRGDAVTLRGRVGGIVVSTPGVAAEDGRVGQWIRVKNANSQKEARALVLDSKTVEVQL